LTILDERVASPTELSELLEEDRYTIYRHVKDLEKANCIELVATDKRRGGTQHFYKAIIRPIIDTEAAERLPQLLRETQSAQIVPLVIGDVVEAAEARAFDSHPARSLLRSNFVYDGQAMTESGEAAMRFFDELQEIQARSAGRIAESGEEGMNVSSAVFVFRTARQR
jgi:hypothetical protein